MKFEGAKEINIIFDNAFNSKIRNGITYTIPAIIMQRLGKYYEKPHNYSEIIR